MANVTNTANISLDDDQITFRETLLKQHNDNIREANGRATRLYQQFLTQMRFSFWLTIISFVVLCAILIAVISIGLHRALQDRDAFVKYFGAGISVLSTLLIIVLIYNNPLKMARKSMAELIKINVVYMGYTRQIYQIDAEFKKALLEDNASQNIAKALARQIQSTTDQTVTTLTISMEEFSE
jgi:hypothetical protein